MAKYNPKEIELKWQRQWEKDGIYNAEDFSKKEKWYSLFEFPYPSGSGLHIGHTRPTVAMDVISRKRRMEGYNVLYPIGWDAFGLPTENYAIKTGISPQQATKENTDRFREQLKSLGLSFDWTREINTTDPKYYKWTQWIFLQLFKKGLAYKAKTEINWCPNCKIGLANEEVVAGRCERCGSEVEKREKEQWMLKITEYAEKLLEGLEDLDFLPEIKTQQRNWIGKSEGAEIEFRIKDQHKNITVFTTRADTLFGATYVVLAPEHPLVHELEDQIENLKEVKEYIQQAGKKNEIERTTEEKEKTGVELKGVRAVNPATKEEISVWIADYVLPQYGTGAIMAVPAHDERDFAFAKKYNLEIRQTIAPILVCDGEFTPQLGKKEVRRNVVTAIIRNKKDEYLLLKRKGKHTAFVGGGIDGDETPERAALREITEETGYTDLKIVRELPYNFYGHGFKSWKDYNCFDFEYFFEVELLSDKQVPLSEGDRGVHTNIWVDAEKVDELLERSHHKQMWNLFRNRNYCFSGNGLIMNSEKFDGMNSEDAREKIAQEFGTPKTQYKLRDWVFSRQRYWGEPIPLVHCEKCGWIAVPEDQLPVELPEVEKYQPRDDGESPLASLDEWVNTQCPQCKGPAKRETDVMPNWAGSSWYFLRYTDPANDKAFAGKKNLKYWMPVDWYNGGMEHVTLHLLYSRFWNHFLYDLGVVPSKEPYTKRTTHGLILAEGGVKMSKSKGNVIDPLEFSERFGADAFRLYIMFIGPFDQAVAWDKRGILGTSRFLEKVSKLQDQRADASDPGIERLLHKTVKKVSQDIEKMSFNTAISAMMSFVNEASSSKISSEDFKIFLQILAPFAPHISEELWMKFGEKKSIHLSEWPEYDQAFIQEESFELVIQVNGKTRGSIQAPVGLSQDEAERLAKESTVGERYLSQSIKKAIYVQDRLINFIV
ncbi:MAG: class I tRNA ligase family protein [Candidatus Harrisonbacteria bacterium]|nr:class I tRNA ligase family protein [Candidatus Harrisonbacteria bacterium]